jgi:hypothetical protein
MSCIHKFYGHEFHQTGEFGLLPKWKAKTLIIGTFNPANNFHPQNTALYFYGRKRNYFWDILPLFAGESPIDKSSPQLQKLFLEIKQIALTDLLISIEDAELSNSEHIRRIKTVKDKGIEKFQVFNWNTENIKNYIEINKIEAVYFTYLSKEVTNINSFEKQTCIIEEFCRDKNIITSRLFTPSGQGLRSGIPRKNKLINKWYNENGANRFPFLSSQFDINNYPFG